MGEVLINLLLICGIIVVSMLIVVLGGFLIALIRAVAKLIKKV